ncbi:MAG: choline dehydrogenase [Gammaproteobacteria bacterium]|nr:choline dehydrogenase [Gammaproteobacteria bacterium]MYD77120.1 choline dehydrogenase [Gammaproteobacteria bacterium]MYJ52349.1 choline dehydrogenase [Gammaproteobacteria bacterium]
MTESLGTWDYIVIGAGSAGCVVASRLSENPSHRVLLLEAGPDDGNPWLHIPVGYARTFHDSRFNWKFSTSPDPGINGRTSYWPRGRVLGGSSSINAMVFSRGQHSDYDDWEQLGAEGWSWRDVAPYFRRLEDAAFTGHPLRGRGGPMPVAEVSGEAHPVNPSFLEGCRELGFACNGDYNAESSEGVGYYQINTRHGLRVSAAKAYLRPAMKRKNLRVLTGALVHRLEFGSRSCTAVVFEWKGRRVHAMPGREAILSAGAIGSPMILQRSGIGDAKMLKSHGIEVVKQAPQVGRNLQDHLGISYFYRSRIPTLNDELNSLSGRIRAGLKYLLFRSGPLSVSVNQSGGFVRSSLESERPNVQLYLQAMSYLDCPPGARPMIRLDRQSAFSIGTSQCRPTSRGTIRIASADPQAKPIIDPGYLSTEHDVREALEAARLIRRIAATDSMRRIIENEILPGDAVQADDELLEDFRNRADTVFHPSCTCRIGQDYRQSVVNPRLMVHGMENVRVIDASVFPVLPTGNINAPTIMVGEKGADFVLADAKR